MLISITEIYSTIGCLERLGPIDLAPGLSAGFIDGPLHFYSKDFVNYKCHASVIYVFLLTARA